MLSGSDFFFSGVIVIPSFEAAAGVAFSERIFTSASLTFFSSFSAATLYTGKAVQDVSSLCQFKSHEVHLLAVGGCKRQAFVGVLPGGEYQ